MGAVFFGLLTVFSEFGVTTAVITLQDLTAVQIAQLNGLAVLLGIVGFLVSCAVAVPAGRFFGFAKLPAVIIVMSLGFVVASFQSVPSALLQRELKFKLLSVIEGARAFLTAIVTVVLAIAGLHYWTLVIGSLVGCATGTVLLLLQERRPFAWPKFSDLEHAIRFSWHVLVSRISWYTYSNSDFAIAGKMLGETALGSYTVAWNLANLPVEKITNLLAGVTPAFFSTVQNDLGAIRKYLLNLTESVAMLTFPAAIGMALVVNDFVLLALGPKWSSAVAPLRLLALYVSVRSITPLLSQVLIAIGETRFSMWTSVLNVFVFPPAFYIGSRWGAVGIAAAWFIVYPVFTIPLYWKVFRSIRLSLKDYLRVLRPAFNGVVLMTLAVLAVGRLLRPEWPLAVRFGIETAWGTAVYFGTLALFHRQRLHAIYRRLRPVSPEAPIARI